MRRRGRSLLPARAPGRAGGASGRARSGLAMVEVVVSAAILGGLVSAVLTAVGAAALTRARAVERVQGAALAQQFMGEILNKPYTDPGTAQPAVVGGVLNLLGTIVTASTPGGTLTRASFDSIDDYNGWTCSPPIDQNDTILTAFSGWTQSASVERVSRTDPGGAASGSETGLKRITVVITRNGREVARLVALRAAAWEGVLDAR